MGTNKAKRLSVALPSFIGLGGDHWLQLIALPWPLINLQSTLASWCS